MSPVIDQTTPNQHLVTPKHGRGKLAPRFTSASARELQKKSAEAFRRNREIYKSGAKLLAEPDLARTRLAGILARVFAWMERTNSEAKMAKYVSWVDKLWPKAFGDDDTSRKKPGKVGHTMSKPPSLPPYLTRSAPPRAGRMRGPQAQNAEKVEDRPQDMVNASTKTDA